MSSAVGDEIVSRDGTTIGVWRSGDGPPLVLVHGAAADHSRWAPVLPALEQRFTVLAIDRRGRGASGDASDYEIEREYEDLAEVVASVGEEAAVLGHSYGGICALECALLTAGHDSPRRAGEQGARLRSNRFRMLHLPTSFLLGGESSAPFKEAAEAVREALPECRVAVMPGQRHAAMDTATELFTEEALGFLGAE
jgi:pimeloyl-ACP methyl ester carboxylesterase